MFRLSAEKAHYLTMSLFNIGLSLPFGKKIFKSLYQKQNTKLEREVFGLKFPNPVGLAAGFDKDGRFFEQMSHLGFGFIEIGTVTPVPQDGNPKPRLFRLPEDHALINRMGFNNQGVDAMVKRLKERSNDQIIIGGNIGKNKVTPNQKAFEDYKSCFEKLFPYVDYFVLNVSSPNTPNLRELQEKEPLKQLIQEVQALNRQKIAPKPILLKIAPDLTNGQLDDIIEIVEETQLAGIISTNTTIDRSNLKTTTQTIEQIGNGGLSGKPLKERSNEVIRYIHQKTNGSIPIIGVGGIESPKDAEEKLKAGATLVQIYTGLIYSGPSLIRQINEALLKAK